RFAAEDLASTARNLYKAWECTRVPRVLTISDLRRARRATGLSLEDISSACGISSALLRELEWGYLKRWRNDAVGRSWLSGYAKASGLDEQLVTSIVVPMLEEEQRDPRARTAAEMALVAAGPQALIPSGIAPSRIAPSEIPPPGIEPAARPHRGRPLIWALASAAVIAVIALVAFIATLERPKIPTPIQARAVSEAPIQARAVSVREFVPEVVNPDEPLIRADTPLPTHLPTHLRSAVRTQPVAPAHVSKGRASVKHGSRAVSLTRRPARPNFFKRQLLRIIFIK
ncbi:MAG TPA: helix-turn-helix domain-containing protein, partial [Vicinamibacterales bacterium]